MSVQDIINFLDGLFYLVFAQFPARAICDPDELKISFVQFILSVYIGIDNFLGLRTTDIIKIGLDVYYFGFLYDNEICFSFF